MFEIILINTKYFYIYLNINYLYIDLFVIKIYKII